LGIIFIDDFDLFSHSVLGNPFEVCGLLLVTILFFPFTHIFSQKKNTLGLWLCCYVLIIHFVLNSLINMYLSKDPAVILGYFSLTFLLGLFIPDFKRRFLPSILFYAITVYIVSRLSLSPFKMIELQIIFFLLTLAIVIIKMSHYNSKVNNFVEKLQLKELNEKLEALSTTDELTKLDNRRSFMHYFEMIWKQASRLKTPISVMMIDIDYFKKYNDSLGHLEGDKALFAVAQCLKNHAKRETDFAARFGGEEFVCLLPYIKKSDAEDFAKKLVQSIEDMKIPHPKSEHSSYLTISAGLATIIPNENDTPQQLLDAADKALYEAKEGGRNQVVVR
jgi:diguanylate cyclase (GGDEF)-like protein